jgi:hypothetical protein
MGLAQAVSCPATNSSSEIFVNGACKTGIAVANTTINDPTYSGSCTIGSISRDSWGYFYATNTSATIIASNSIGGTKQLSVVVYNGPACPSGASTVAIACANANTTAGAQTETVNLTGLTIGQKYWVRLFQSATNNITDGQICITSPVRNDDPAGAFTLPVASAACTSTFSSTKSATKTTTCGIGSPGCSSTYGASSNDVWFTVAVPAAGLFLQTTAGSMNQAGMAVYTGAPCGSFTEIGCSEGNPEGSTYGGMPVMYLPAGTPSPVYIRVWNKHGQTAGSFSICATTLGPCGNDATNDFCSNPTAINTTGATGGDVAVNNTGLVYTVDEPGDVTSVACMPPNLNSWFSFIATSADNASGLSIPFSMDLGSGCTGLEAEIFEISKNAYGCCKDFTQLDEGCNDTDFDGAFDGSVYDWTGFDTFTLTVNPGVLTAGNTYYMMVNNYEDACSFSITGWSISGTLPMELVSFVGNNEGKFNVLEWVVASQKNVESYTLEHSPDARNFVPIATMLAKDDQGNVKYSYNDENPFTDVTYYRIKQKDTDGREKYSNTISVSLKSLYDNIYNIHPNPTADNLYFEYYSKSTGIIDVELLGYAGNVVYQQHQRLEEGKNYVVLPMSQLDNGVYILKVVSVKSGKTTYHKIIKN